MKRSKSVDAWLDGIRIHRDKVYDKLWDLNKKLDEVRARFNKEIENVSDFSTPGRKELRMQLYNEIDGIEHQIKPLNEWMETFDVLLADKMYMNRLGYTDVTPYEVVEMITPRKFVVREMIVIEKEESRRKRIESFIPGGFCGHTDNDVQDWEIIPNNNPDTRLDIVVRMHKNGYWYDVNGSRYELDSKPRKFYDFNF